MSVLWTDALLESGKDVRIVAERKHRYRRLLLAFLIFALLGGSVWGYWYLRDSVPDKIYVDREEGPGLEPLTDHPLVTFSEDLEVFSGSSYEAECSIMGVVPLKTVQVEAAERPVVQVCGAPIGIYMETEGVLIVDAGEIRMSDGSLARPAENIVKAGDYIRKVDGRNLENKQELMDLVAGSGGEDMVLEVWRQGETVDLKLTPVQDENGSFKLGIWVRDNIQGIGTLTYVDSSGGFGALGHGISDVDVGEILQADGGKLYQADILSVVKGQDGVPGELKGVIRYYPEEQIGEIRSNSSVGIYGTLSKQGLSKLPLRQAEIGWKQEVREGPASILCMAGGTLKEYEIQITAIHWDQQDTNKCFTIQVTDPELLELTGGIVQGMSGSPILQDGRLIGAVTHVFVSDAASGYGVFIENMLEAAG
mgnify:FL=1